MLTLVNNSSSKGCIRQTSFNYTNSPLLFVTCVSLWGCVVGCAPPCPLAVTGKCSCSIARRYWYDPGAWARALQMHSGASLVASRPSCRVLDSKPALACAPTRTVCSDVFRTFSGDNRRSSHGAAPPTLAHPNHNFNPISSCVTDQVLKLRRH